MAFIIMDGEDKIERFLIDYGKEAQLTPENVRNLCDFNDASQLRYLSDQFAEMLHTSHTARNHRRYLAEDLPLLKRIRELCQDENLTVKNAMDILLAEGYSRAVSYENKDETGLAKQQDGYLTAYQEINLLLQQVSSSVEDSEKRTKEFIRTQFKQNLKESAYANQELRELVVNQGSIIEAQTRLLEQQQQSMEELKSQIEVLKEQTKKKKPFWSRNKE